VYSKWIFPAKVYPIEFSESPIKVEKDGKFIPLNEDETSIVKILAKHSYTSYRIYSKEEYQENIRKAIKECLGV